MTGTSDTLLKPPRRRHDSPWLRLVLMLATLVVLVDAVFGGRGLAETLKARRLHAEARAELLTLQHANAGLREQARRLSEDPEAIEDVARKELGLIRHGEVRVVVRTVR
ncbi:hypothetical protein BH24ACI5_BH24ACI5_24970 [soil metagenome]